MPRYEPGVLCLIVGEIVNAGKVVELKRYFGAFGRHDGRDWWEVASVHTLRVTYPKVRDCPPGRLVLIRQIYLVPLNNPHTGLQERDVRELYAPSFPTTKGVAR